MMANVGEYTSHMDSMAYVLSTNDVYIYKEITHGNASAGKCTVCRSSGIDPV